MSDYLDDLYAERYSRPTWWKTPPTEPTNYPMRALLDSAEDDALTIARRRRVLAEAYDETREASA